VPHFNSSPLVKIGRSPHPEIFRYRFIDTASGAGHCFAVVMQFYKSSEAIAVLHPKELEQKLRFPWQTQDPTGATGEVNV